MQTKKTLVGLLIAALLTIALPSTGKVIGSDDRQKVTVENVARGIPNVECKRYQAEESQTSSGIVIDRSRGLILTVAHVFVTKNNREAADQEIATIGQRCKVQFRNSQRKLLSEHSIAAYVLGDIFSQDVAESTSGDWAALKLVGDFPKNSSKKALRVVDLSENLVGLRVLNIGYQFIPDNPITAENEEAIGVYAGRGTIRQNYGPPLLGNHPHLFLHDIDINRLSSGSAIHEWRDEQWVVIGMQVSEIGEDFDEYDAITQHNVAIKFHSGILGAFESLLDKGEQ